MHLTDELEFAHELARDAAPIALGFFGSTTSYLKHDDTPVGEADLAVDRMLTQRISSAYPDDAILSEESPPTGRSFRRWILDPVDGTVPFLAGEEEWGTHIALEVDGEVVLGIVTRPMRSEMVWATRGGGAWAGSIETFEVAVPLNVSTISELGSSRVSLWPHQQHPHLVDRVKSNAIWVEPGYRLLGKLLCGEIDAIYALAGGPWDHAPAVILVEEAGGRFTDPLGGRRLDLAGGFFTNGNIHESLTTLLRS